MAQAHKNPDRPRPPAEGVIGREHRWCVPAVCLGLVAITFAVFGQTLSYEFVNCDDGSYVYDNPTVTRGVTIQGIAWAFAFHASNWHPLTWLSHMLDCQLYGLDSRWHHLTNVLWHTATVISLFLVLRQCTGALWRCAFVAAVFAVHPLRVESVAWVAERKDVLSGLLFMLTIAAYAGYARAPRSPFRYGLVALLFAMGLMCKPMLVTLPVVLLLLDYWPLRRVEPVGKLVLEKLPLLALSAVASVLTLMAQSGAIQSSEVVALPLRMGNALVACVVYLRQMIWPTGLAMFYPYPQKGLPVLELAVTGILVAGASAIVWRNRGKQPWLLVGWLSYLVMLVPVVGIIQVGAQAHADRYTYLPQIGIDVAVTWWVAEWGAKRFEQAPFRVAAGALMTSIVAVLAVCAWKQAGYWKNSESLWARSLACTSGNSIAHLNLGTALLQKGRVDDAVTQFQDALEINSGYEDAHFDLGIAYLQSGRVDDAIDQYQRALLLKPEEAKVHVNLGIALLKKGRMEEAISHLHEALRINPNYTEARVNLGNVLAQTGKLDEARTQFEEAVQSKPDDEVAQVNLGIVLLQMGRAGDARAHFQMALQLDPSDVKANHNLAWIMATSPDASLRDGNRAVELARKANELTGGDKPMFLHTLAVALAEAGRFPEAVETAQRTVPMAEAQSNARLAEQLKLEIQLFQAGRAFHTQ